MIQQCPPHPQSFTQHCAVCHQGHMPLKRLGSVLLAPSESFFLFRAVRALHTLCIFSGHSILTSHQGEAGMLTKGSKDSASQRSRLQVFVYINKPQFTYSRSLLLLFQGHLHFTLAIPPHSFLSSTFPFFCLVLPLFSYTVSHAWALQKEIKLRFGMLNYLN